MTKSLLLDRSLIKLLSLILHFWMTVLVSINELDLLEMSISLMKLSMNKWIRITKNSTINKNSLLLMKLLLYTFYRIGNCFWFFKRRASWWKWFWNFCLFLKFFFECFRTLSLSRICNLFSGSGANFIKLFFHSSMLACLHYGKYCTKLFFCSLKPTSLVQFLP